MNVTHRPIRYYGVTALLALPSIFGIGCSSSTEMTENIATREDPIVDVPQTAVERQAIGNCWLYSEASWIESMHKTATNEDYDVSQSYWTYWDWFIKLTRGGGSSGKISTGGFYYTANDIIQRYGLMPDAAFIPQDAEMIPVNPRDPASPTRERETSAAQGRAETLINRALVAAPALPPDTPEDPIAGQLDTPAKRRDPVHVRTILNRVFALDPAMVQTLDATFGTDGATTFRNTANAAGTSIVAPKDFVVAYSKRTRSRGRTPTITTSTVRGTVLDAIREWRVVSYPSSATGRRAFQVKVQRALHDRQPVILTWDVDFNAMTTREVLVDGVPEARVGTFSLKTLERAGKPGREGGHMVVVEDYEVETAQFGTLAAGTTLDPMTDAPKLAAALETASVVTLFRIKNSWGAAEATRPTLGGPFLGYWDLMLDYLNGPIAWCPSTSETVSSNEECGGSTTPLDSVVLPPGYEL